MFSRSFLAKSKFQASFTLIELLIVIAILAVLMSVIIITINPSEMLKRTRDTRRISDLKTLNNAIQYFQSSLPDASLGSLNTVYVSIPDTSATCANLGLPSLPSGWSYKCSTPDNYRKVDGTGWIPINFKQLDIGAPISALPIDPLNQTSTGNYYTYVVGGSWELTAKVESSKYKKGGEADKDGGKSSLVYEIGSDLNLLPAEVLGRGSTYEELTTQESALVGYWKFDEGSGTTAYDSSGYGNNGTLVNGPTWTTGKVGGALSFDGVDDYVRVLDSPSLKGAVFTKIIWFKVLSLHSGIIEEIVRQDYRWLISHRGDVASPYWEIGFMQDAKTTNYWTPSDADFPINNWYQIAIVADGSSYRIYSNVVLKASGTYSGTVRDFNYDLFLGSFSSTARFINALIDDVRIYNRALSAAEIKALYDATK